MRAYSKTYIDKMYYLKGIVYRIRHMELPEICYIGSTTQELKQRWQGHKYYYNKWIEGKKCGVAIFPHFKQYGIENFEIDVLGKLLIKEEIETSTA
jgi:hypothetical protein